MLNINKDFEQYLRKFIALVEEPLKYAQEKSIEEPTQVFIKSTAALIRLEDIKRMLGFIEDKQQGKLKQIKIDFDKT